MSSVVSLRSYQRRRKSAGARLEGAYAQSQSTSPSCIPPVPSRQVPGTAPEGINRPPFLREKRVKSAKETRKEQEASDIFPELQRGGVDPEWGKTKYSEDFYAKKVTPVEVRPLSPTRMNNPHPSKVHYVKQCVALWHVRFCERGKVTLALFVWLHLLVVLIAVYYEDLGF